MLFTLSVPLLAAILFFFTVGYLAIIFEHKTNVNKGGVALLTAAAVWGLILMGYHGHGQDVMPHLQETLAETSAIVFFMLGAMTIVELIDSHNGFSMITDWQTNRNKKTVAWVVAFLTFFTSAILDNLTTTIVMISLLRKLIPHREERWLFGGMVVIAANAGGAWTPIGDLTTTMLWIGHQLTASNIITALFFPSLISMLLPLYWMTKKLEGAFKQPLHGSEQTMEKGAEIFLCMGVAALISVPFLKSALDLPPYLGILMGVGLLWLLSDLYHRRYDRRHLTIPHALTKVDISGVLFFLGILLTVGGLKVSGLLTQLAHGLDYVGQSPAGIAYILGIISAGLDNVPLVASCSAMYPLTQFPQNHPLWEMIAYSAGTGGSLLLIGSAAGVALMGYERISFMWYVRHVTFAAFIGYTAGFLCYLLQNFVR